jgi:hypothetical protein
MRLMMRKSSRSGLTAFATNEGGPPVRARVSVSSQRSHPCARSRGPDRTVACVHPVSHLASATLDPEAGADIGLNRIRELAVDRLHRGARTGKDNRVRTAGLLEIFAKTNGHCHFCGDRIVFEHRGWSERPDGHWEVDHVTQRGKGGRDTPGNCLPACTMCNRLRWHRTGDGLRELLLMGVIAVGEMNKGSRLGEALDRLGEERLAQNALRRSRDTGPPPRRVAEEPVLTVQQPFASAIFRAGKDVENRPWRTGYRGRFWIHAAKQPRRREWPTARRRGLWLPDEPLPRGVILGCVELVDCVRNADSPWAVRGQYHWILARPLLLLHPVAHAGQLGFTWRRPPRGELVRARRSRLSYR